MLKLKSFCCDLNYVHKDGTVELRHKQFFISPKYNMKANFYISTF